MLTAVNYQIEYPEGLEKAFSNRSDRELLYDQFTRLMTDITAVIIESMVYDSVFCKSEIVRVMYESLVKQIPENDPRHRGMFLSCFTEYLDYLIDMFNYNNPCRNILIDSIPIAIEVECYDSHISVILHKDSKYADKTVYKKPPKLRQRRPPMGLWRRSR